MKKGYITVEELKRASEMQLHKDKETKLQHEMKKNEESRSRLIQAMRDRGITAEEFDNISFNVIEQLVRQNRKGRATYGQGLEAAAEDAHDWPDMVNQELIDALQYYEKERQRLLGVIRKLETELEIYKR